MWGSLPISRVLFSFSEFDIFGSTIVESGVTGETSFVNYNDIIIMRRYMYYIIGDLYSFIIFILGRHEYFTILEITWNYYCIIICFCLPSVPLAEGIGQS